jgi:hypothetical protein
MTRKSLDLLHLAVTHRGPGVVRGWPAPLEMDAALIYRSFCCRCPSTQVS